MSSREVMSLVRRLVRAWSAGRAAGPVQIVWGNLLVVLVLLLLLWWVVWRTSPFEQACVGIAPGTPLAEAAGRLESAGGTPSPADVPDVMFWSGPGGYPWLSCAVGIDRRERVTWTRFDRVYIRP